MSNSETVSKHKLLKYFGYSHLPANLQSISKPFHDLALNLSQSLPDGEEKDLALRKLLEAKDCAVRSHL